MKSFNRRIWSAVPNTKSFMDAEKGRVQRWVDDHLPRRLAQSDDVDADTIPGINFCEGHGLQPARQLLHFNFFQIHGICTLDANVIQEFHDIGNGDE